MPANSRKNAIEPPNETLSAASALAETIKIPAIASGELLRESRELHILHGGEVYRLRLTKQNKLILTK